MILTKDKAIKLFDKLEKYCKEHKINMPHDSNLRTLQFAKIIMRRYGSIVLVDTSNNNVIKFRCNNYRYFKRWTYEQSLKNAGSPFKLVNCGELSRKYIKSKQKNG